MKTHSCRRHLGQVLVASVIALQTTCIVAAPPWDLRPAVTKVADTISSAYLGRDVASHPLAWLIQYDRLELIIEGMLYWTTYQTSAGKRWALVAIYRHPEKSSPWTVEDVCHYTHHSREQYDHAPSSSEIGEFASRWFSVYSDFKFFGGGVNELDWRNVVGDDPPEIREFTAQGRPGRTG